MSKLCMLVKKNTETKDKKQSEDCIIKNVRNLFRLEKNIQQSKTEQFKILRIFFNKKILTSQKEQVIFAGIIILNIIVVVI